MNNLLDQQLPSQGNPVQEAIDHGASAFIGGFPQIMDSSMLSAGKTCEELFRKSYVEHWKPKESNVHLHAGGAFAKGLEVARRAFFTGEVIQPSGLDENGKPLWVTSHPYEGSGVSADDATAYGLQALLHAYGSYDCPEDSAKSASRMAGALEFYFANYPLEHSEDGEGEPLTLPGGKRGIEFSFCEPCDVNHPVTSDPILIVGRMDMLMKFCGGRYIEDDKTTTALGASWSRQWDLRGQFSGYAWACKRNGIEVDGAVIRGVSILKTKYDTQQAISNRPEWQIDRWYNEAMIWIQRLITAWKTGVWLHNLDHACAEYGGCSFRQCCQSLDEQPWLETNFERRVWNPLLREEKKV